MFVRGYFMTDCVIRSRIDPVIKAEAVELFEHMGLTLSEAIRLFLYQSVAQKTIPFSIVSPNTETKAVLSAIDQNQGLEKTSLQKLSDDWDL
jgi:DNA-damage-inducible protein J